MELITPSTGLLFWMLLIFGLLFFVLAKFGFPAITGSIRKRSDSISAALKDAQDARDQLAGMQQTCQKMLEETHIQQAKLLEQAKDASRKIVEEAKAQASKEAAETIERAKEEIEVRKREAIVEVRNVIAELSIAVSEKILKDKLGDNNEEQMAVIDKWVKEVQDKKFS